MWGLVEIVKVEAHPYIVGYQFHPEFKSRLDNPHPPFVGLIRAASAM
jgi:CTP synthase